MESFINLRRFFDAFKALTFWKRLFSWHAIRSLSYAAIEDLVQLSEEVKDYQQEIETLKRERDGVIHERNLFQQQVTDSKSNLIKVESRVQHLDQELKRISSENQDLQRKVLLVEQKDEQRRREHDQSLGRFATLQANAENERREFQAKQLRVVEEKNLLMKETWKRHEETVENAMKSICERHLIEYVTSVPFKGKPDNVIRICDELIVFDAKSPASDDLGNFNTYIRTQAEALSKYASHESVRKDVYLVVPSNTIDVLKKTTFLLGNFNVYVITLDALEPVIVSLKKLEEYEFAEQLSPEDRQSICRIIGGLLYTSKRRIQVDQFFNSHVLELLSQTQREIPELMQEEISKHEKAMKLNPSADRRSKEISQESLEKIHAQQAGQARVFEILPVDLGLGLAVNG